jgi:serine/threonine protein kinase/tetratricopeptide (TPR) repeat protein
MSAPSETLPVTRHVEQMPALPLTDELTSGLLAEMNQAWRRGERSGALDYVRRHPELAGQRDPVLRLVCEELCLRRETGLEVDEAALAGQFPQWRGEILALLACRELLDDNSLTTKALGTVRGFQLLAQLGQGGLGRVYLATQPQLADRPVVVKVTPCRGQEHLSLARLQHTNIVPLYWVHDHPEDDQRVLCMPYFGTVTLQSLLPALQKVPLAERTGQHILEVLDKSQSQPVPSATLRGPWRKWLTGRNYAHAIAWMGASLAEALAFAHARDLLHLDIKPSNILWATEGQPMLLDFHLARGAMRPDDRPRGLGGTPLFMAPEQEAALNAVCQGQPIPEPIDGRADVYALGLVLYQALGGTLPAPPLGPPRLDRINPQVTPGLADIIAKCIQPRPEYRYKSAEHLASDLHRHLNHQPLKGVPNRNWSERWDKWRRREPKALANLMLMAATAITIFGVGGVLWRERQNEIARREQFDLEQHRRLKQAEAALDKTRSHAAAGQYDASQAALEAGRMLLPETAEAVTLAETFAAEQLRLKRLRYTQAAQETLNQLRQAAVAEDFAPGALVSHLEGCRRLWENLHELEIATGADGDRLRQDIIDLAILWGDFRVRAASAYHVAAERREAVAILDQAARDYGATGALVQARVEHLQALGEDTTAAALELSSHPPGPTTPWEHITVARRLMLRAPTYSPPLVASQAARLAALSTPGEALGAALAPPEHLLLWSAAEHLRQAVLEAPDNFWANYYRGVCAFRLRQSEEAVTAFRVCAALAPRDAAVWHNQGFAQLQAGAWEEAVRACTRALEFDPKLVMAAINRAIAQAELGNAEAAAADLDRAEQMGTAPGLIQAGRARVARVSR